MNEPTTGAALATTDDTAVTPELDSYLRAASIVKHINATLPEGYGLPPIPDDYVFKRFDREAVSLALHAAFQLNGGVPGLLLWARQDPKAFYALWAKLLPAEQALAQQGLSIVFNSPVPENPLDAVRMDISGTVITHDADLEDAPE